MTSPAVDPAPVRERHDLIDALRGFALGGVLMVNLVSFTLYEFLSDTARAALPTAGFDSIALQAMDLLVNVKFITLFSLLFGLGFSLQMERAEASGGLARFVRRLLILLVIGLVHSYFIWWGDILLTYAVVGLLLVCFRNASDRTLLVAGLVIALLLPPLLSPWIREALGAWPKQAQVYVGALQAFSSQSPGAALRGNIDMANWARVSNWALVCFVLGRFLLGYWAGRRGLFQHPLRHKSLIARLFWGSLLAGIAMTILQFTQAGSARAVPVARHRSQQVRDPHAAARRASGARRRLCHRLRVAVPAALVATAPAGVGADGAHGADPLSDPERAGHRLVLRHRPGHRAALGRRRVGGWRGR